MNFFKFCFRARGRLPRPPAAPRPQFGGAGGERGTDLDPDVEKAQKEAEIAWANSFKDCFEANRKMFKTILKGFMKPFWLSIGMNVAVFVVGIVSFSLAVVLSLINGQYLLGVVFAGIDAMTFLTFFLSNPIKNLERDMGFIAWLGIIYNTYWTRSYYATAPDTFLDDMKKITDDTAALLEKLLLTHKDLSKLQFQKQKSESPQSTERL